VKNRRIVMSTVYVNRINDEDIIDMVRYLLNNGTAETMNEHILIKLMQIRNTPIKNMKFDQERVDTSYETWKEDASDHARCN